MTAPRATMRLQMHCGFTFADAARLVPYMASLGISHLYASPILAARPGSMHGYDVTDPTLVNPELGGEAGFRHLAATLRDAGLGLVVDIVPNHMAAGGMENRWWGDVMQHGRRSQYASFFDIDWNTSDPALHGKILAPFLGTPYGEALRSGEITLVHDDGCPAIRYYDTVFPIRPEDHAEIAGFPSDAYDPANEKSRVRLHRLLERQHYRLAWWRCAGDEINWRRFFDINGLAALRIEDDAVFEATHATLFRLYGDGLIDGFRIDHVDGLSDPPGYCRRLRARLAEIAPSRHAWIVVEKILGSGERLPDDWAVDGTSGYDFMDEVGALLHDAAGQAPLRRLWHSLTGRPADFEMEELEARRDVLDRSFTAQLDATAAGLHRLAAARPETRDFTHAAIRRALTALLAQFRIYRTYADAPSSEFLSVALARALTASRSADRPVLEQIARWLGDTTDKQASVRFQQLSAPLAAKALEDTAYYRYGVLLSRNEVGADSTRFSMTADEFHNACLWRHRHFPSAMLATATHDHKRGEDVRARLAVLSEITEEWEDTVRRWFTLNTPHRRNADGTMPSPGDEAMLYQMIVGAWPLLLDPADAKGVREFAERLAGWQLKALREAKLATDWIAPDLEYEDAARSFLYTIMSDDRFLAEAAGFACRIGPAGAVNGLTQTLLKLTVPGVPDFYQGAEFWDLSLVDPDNRRPVDFSMRAETLGDDASLTAHWRDGRVKQAMIRRALALRREVPKLFARGSYQPLRVSGPRAANVVAFMRSLDEAHCVVVVPRLVSGLLGAGAIIPAPEMWEDTVVHLQEKLAGLHLHDRMGAGGTTFGPRLQVAQLLAPFPVALLEARA